MLVCVSWDSVQNKRRGLRGQHDATSFLFGNVHRQAGNFVHAPLANGVQSGSGKLKGELVSDREKSSRHAHRETNSRPRHTPPRVSLAEEEQRLGSTPFPLNASHQESSFR